MLKGRMKQKAKSKVKSKAKSRAKQRVRGAVGPGGGDHKVLKAAAVGGTAYYAGKKISEKEQEAQAQTDASPSQPEAAATTGTGSDTVAQLQELAQLHDSGVLTDEEFASAKQKILAGG